MARTTYSGSGVNLRKVSKIHEDIADRLQSTFANRKETRGSPLLSIGHYAGLIDLGGDQVLAIHSDGVGSKVLVAQQMRKFDTVGIDCVAMTVNDLICVGAEPLALVDYLALARENDALVSQVMTGLQEGARLSSTAIVGGETAILGDIIKGVGRYGFDLAATGVGLVRKDRIVDGSEIEAGDSVVGVESSGLHSNGYTLVRKILQGIPLRRRVRELGSELGEVLLTPTRIYVKPALATLESSEVHGIAHITGGGFTKLTRLVRGRKLGFDLVLPEAPPVFSYLRRLGRVSEAEMLRTFNMGIGLCLVLSQSDATQASREFKRSGFKTHVIGKVVNRDAVLVGGRRIV